MSLRRIAVIGTNGALPRSFSMSTEDAFEATGRNTGNLAFQFGFAHHVTGTKSYFSFSFRPEEIASDHDVVCLPAANFLYSGFDLGSLADRLDKCNLPIVVVGLGAQAFKSIDEVKLQPGTERLLHLLAERGKSIAVRGKYTASVLERHGVTNFDVLGCPSNFINLDASHGKRIEERCLLPLSTMTYCPTFYQYNSEFELQILRAFESEITHIICQDPLHAVAAARGEAGAEATAKWVADASGFLKSLDTEQRNRRLRELRTFFDASAWTEFYRGQDAVIGPRIHGVNLGWQCGRPSAVISYDLRTEELAETMGIPCVKANRVESIASAQRLLDFVRPFAAQYDSRRAQLSKIYVAYLRSNGLEPSQELEGFSNFGSASAGLSVANAMASPSENIVMTTEKRKSWGFLEQYNRRSVAGWVSSNVDTAPVLKLKIDGNVTKHSATMTRRMDLDGFGWAFHFHIEGVEFERNVAKFEVVEDQGDALIRNSPVVASVAFDDDKKVLVGYNGYLFLQNDSNDVLRQITAERQLSTKELQGWREAMTVLDDQMGSRAGLAIWLVAPNKECVFAEHLPREIRVSNQRPVEQLRELFESLALRNSCFLYPLDAMKAAGPDGSYSKGDSHWSDLGAHVVAQQLAELLAKKEYVSTTPDFSAVKFVREYRNADLLSKLGRTCVEIQTARKYPFENRKVEDNGVTNTGWRRQYEGLNRANSARIQLWHDSFGDWLIPYLAELCSKTASIWSPVINLDDVKAFSPNVVIVEKAERFLIQPPRFEN